MRRGQTSSFSIALCSHLSHAAVLTRRSLPLAEQDVRSGRDDGQ